MGEKKTKQKKTEGKMLMDTFMKYQVDRIIIIQGFQTIVFIIIVIFTTFPYITGYSRVSDTRV